MRIFDDDEGARWQAALMMASYGNILLLFNPMKGTDVRKVLIDADYMAEAGARLAALTDDELRGMLKESVAWDGGKIFAQMLEHATK